MGNQAVMKNETLPEEQGRMNINLLKMVTHLKVGQPG